VIVTVFCFCFLQKVPENPLTEEAVAECLSLLCKTGDGLAHAYVRLDVHERFVFIMYFEIPKTYSE